MASCSKQKTYVKASSQIVLILQKRQQQQQQNKKETKTGKQKD